MVSWLRWIRGYVEQMKALDQFHVFPARSQKSILVTWFPTTSPVCHACFLLLRQSKTTVQCRKRRLKRTCTSHSYLQFTLIPTCVSYYYYFPSKIHFQIYHRHYLTYTVLVQLKTKRKQTIFFFHILMSFPTDGHLFPFHSSPFCIPFPLHTFSLHLYNCSPVIQLCFFFTFMCATWFWMPFNNVCPFYRSRFKVKRMSWLLYCFYIRWPWRFYKQEQNTYRCYYKIMASAENRK